MFKSGFMIGCFGFLRVDYLDYRLGDFLNPALALLGQGLKKSPIGQKLDLNFNVHN
jgi:hypothetical protein